MTEPETRYAQIEKELLAVPFGMERFNQYTYGKEVSVECDHKPIESIVKNPLASSPSKDASTLTEIQLYGQVQTRIRNAHTRHAFKGIY